MDIKKRTAIKLAGKASARVADKSLKLSQKTHSGVEQANDIYDSRYGDLSRYGEDKASDVSKAMVNRAKISAGRKISKVQKSATRLNVDVAGTYQQSAERLKVARSGVKTAHQNVQAVKASGATAAMIKQAQKELYIARRRAVEHSAKAAVNIAVQGIKAVVKAFAFILSGTGLLILLVCVLLLSGAIMLFTPDPDAQTGPQPMTANAVYYFLRTDVGLNSAAACGIVANIQQESGFDATVVGDQGTSYGLCQWHESRWDRLNDFCAEGECNPANVMSQLKYLAWELQHYFPDLLSTLKQVDDTAEGCYDAAAAFCKNFENPQDAEIKADERGMIALQNYWATFGVNEASGLWTEQGMKLALTAYQEQGNDGYKYWIWYGFPERVEWCAIFVSWCGAQNGYIASGIMPLSANVDHYLDGYQWYYNHADMLLADSDVYPAPGMVAFFRRGHTGIVFGTTANSIVLVEGNSGDTVAIREYAIENVKDEIWGYGVPNFAY